MSRLPFLSRGKLYLVETDNTKTQTLIAQYWGDAVAHFRATGQTWRLDRYRNRTIAGHPFEVDPEVKLVGVDVDGEATPFPPGEAPDPSDLLSDELDKYSRDPVYEAAVLASLD